MSTADFVRAEIAALPCPHCSEQLIVDGAIAGTLLVCPSCLKGTEWSPQASDAQSSGSSAAIGAPRVSRAAIWAMWLGIASFIPLLGPAAFFLGGKALVEIVRHPGRVGRGRAVIGLVAGALGTALSLIVGLALWVFYQFDPGSLEIRDPERLQEVYQEGPQFDLPPGVQPTHAMQIPMIGQTRLEFSNEVQSDERPWIVLNLHVFPRQNAAQSTMFKSSEISEVSNAWSFEHKRTEFVEMSIAGTTERVEKRIGRNRQTGIGVRHYLVGFSRRNRFYMISLAVNDPPADGEEAARGSLDEEQARQLIESFRIPE